MATLNWSAYFHQSASISDDNVRGVKADISLETDNYKIGGWGTNVIGMQLFSDFEMYIGFFPETDTSLPAYYYNNYISIGYRDSTGTYEIPVRHEVSKGDTAHEVAMYLDDSGQYVFSFIDGELVHAGHFNIASDGVSKFFMETDIPRFQDTTFRVDNIAYAVTPEPTTLALIGLGGLLIRKRK